MEGRPGWDSRYYEDLRVDEVFRHPLGRTISETDNTWFTLLTGKTNQMHFNSAYAELSSFGRLLVNSGFTLALVLGLSVGDLSQNAVANLGFDNVRFTYPVFIGDTIWAESKILEKRESRSRPYAGIVTARTRGLNQHGEQCVDFRRTFMVYKRDADRLDAFPEPKQPFE